MKMPRPGLAWRGIFLRTSTVRWKAIGSRWQSREASRPLISIRECRIKDFSLSDALYGRSGSRTLADENNRVEARSNVFLTATLHTGGKAISIRVRNLSEHGALVDGSGLPPAGSRIKLMRGKLAVFGELAWAGGGQAGLNFETKIAVDAWVQKLGHGGQQRVDGVIASLRSGGSVPPELHDDDGTDESLPAISAALDQVCEKLAQSPIMSIDLAEELLKLDTIAQSLRRLATGKPF